MENITFSLASVHQHGTAFYDYLKLRKHFFVDVLGWDIPHNDLVEMDQYDNPLAHYSLVLSHGRVVGGARTMPTSAHWGGHTYMLRDAVEGKLTDIPKTVMNGDIETPLIWECTRLVMSDALHTQPDRSQCLALIVEGLADVARRNGASQLISLSPLSLMRALRQLGWQAERIGEPYQSPEDGRRYAVLTMPAEKARVQMAAE
ncbi:MAG: autoinducer synthase [Rhodobacteraceae bacterium]|nr:autoinducer synthase [Paracoccaceae bacterium]